MKWTKKLTGLVILILVCVVTIIPLTEAKADGYTGMFEYNGQYYYMRDGQVDWNYTGLASNEYGWWYYQNGLLDFGFNGMACNEWGWWYIRNGQIDFNFTGLACNDWGWWYFQNGWLDFGFTGLVPNEWGWWYVRNGQIDFGYTGLVPNEYGWWYVRNGQIDFGYTGLVPNEYGWWCVQNGQINFGYTGMASNENGWWYVRDGQIDFGYTGMASNDYGWWYYQDGVLNPYYWGIGVNAWGKWYYHDGMVDFNYTDVIKLDGYGWVYINNGKYEDDYTGVVTNKYGTWYFKNGQIQNDPDNPNASVNYTGITQDQYGNWVYMKDGAIDTDYTGMAENENGWWYFENGKINFSYKGVGRNPYGTWYFNNGRIDTNYKGDYKDGSVTYAVSGGKAVAKSSTNLLLGVFYNSREDTSNTLYVSFDGYTFHSLGEAFSDYYRNDENSDLADCSPSLQLKESDSYYPYYKDWNVYSPRDPNIFYKDGYFWIVATARGGEESKTFIPQLAFSKDLVNWSYMTMGIDTVTGVNYNITPSAWLNPTTAAPATNSKGGYDAVAGDTLVDDDGTVWFVVATGRYTDDHNNALSSYLVKITDLSVIDGDLSTLHAKCDNSRVNVHYGPAVPINLPLSKYNINKTWNHGDFDYDGSIYKKDGKYYYIVQHSGEIVMLWSIDSLDRVSDPNAWTLVNADVTEGSEGPCIVEFNGKTIVYTDRYPGWKHFDIWGVGYGITASTSSTLINGGNEYPSTERISLLGVDGKTIPARHGKVINVTDSNAIKKILSLYN